MRCRLHQVTFRELVLLCGAGAVLLLSQSELNIDVFRRFCPLRRIKYEHRASEESNGVV